MFEFFSETLMSLIDMNGGDHPLILDRRIKLTPITDSFHLPAFYNWLLFPFSEHKVQAYNGLRRYELHAC